jgi:hypothetical protein
MLCEGRPRSVVIELCVVRPGIRVYVIGSEFHIDDFFNASARNMGFGNYYSIQELGFHEARTGFKKSHIQVVGGR